VLHGAGADDTRGPTLLVLAHVTCECVCVGGGGSQTACVEWSE
jgi:hypothetical protein